MTIASNGGPPRTGQEDTRDDVPTLAIDGKKDQLDSAETAKVELIPHLHRAVLQVRSDPGHLYPVEAPTELVRPIEKFARELC